MEWFDYDGNIDECTIYAIKGLVGFVVYEDELDGRSVVDEKTEKENGEGGCVFGDVRSYSY